MIVQFPVDSTIAEFSLSASVSGDAVARRLTQPNGKAVDAAALGANSSLFTINAPKPGVWRLELEGKKGAYYSAAGRGKANLSLDAPTFMVEEGRPGHEGLFSNRSKPITGENEYLRLEMTGDYSSIAFELIDEAGKTVTKLSVTKDDVFNDRTSRKLGCQRAPSGCARAARTRTVKCLNACLRGS